MRVTVELIIVGWVVGCARPSGWKGWACNLESKATNKLLGCLSQTSGCLPSKKCSSQSPPRWGSKIIEKEKEREREGGRRVGECYQATAPPTSCSPPHKQESATSKSPNRNKTENKAFISPSAIEASASCVNKCKSGTTKQNKKQQLKLQKLGSNFKENLLGIS